MNPMIAHVGLILWNTITTCSCWFVSSFEVSFGFSASVRVVLYCMFVLLVVKLSQLALDVYSSVNRVAKQMVRLPWEFPYQIDE
jgi:hypothetical protein